MHFTKISGAVMAIIAASVNAAPASTAEVETKLEFPPKPESLRTRPEVANKSDISIQATQGVHLVNCGENNDYSAVHVSILSSRVATKTYISEEVLNTQPSVLRRRRQLQLCAVQR